MSEPKRYINRGNFGTRGIDRVSLWEVRSTGVFCYCHWWEGKLRIRSLKTTDLAEAKTKIAELMAQKRDGKPASVEKGETILYVIQRGDDGPIKVGISRNLKGRLGGLQNGNAEKLKVRRMFKMRDVERVLHAELERVSRLQGEWFPAELIELVDRFFRPALDVEIARHQKRTKAVAEKIKTWEKSGLL